MLTCAQALNKSPIELDSRRMIRSISHHCTKEYVNPSYLEESESYGLLYDLPAGGIHSKDSPDSLCINSSES